MDRREVLKALTALGSLYLTNPGVVLADAHDSGQHPLFPWINQQTGPRPLIGWFSGEEYAYHELAVKPEWQRAPEFYPFFDHKAVTNRQFEWIRANDCIAVVTKGRQLVLTGTKPAADWYSDPDNQISSSGDYTTFTAKSAKRCREAMVIPAFQFNLHQHPVWKFNLTEVAGQCQLVIAVKGRAGLPLYHSAWLSQPTTLSIDLATILATHGHDLNFAQIHVAVVLWKDHPKDIANVTVQLTAVTKPTPILPVAFIRELNSRGYTIPVWYCDSSGKLKANLPTSIDVKLNAKPVKLTNGQLNISSLSPGNHVLQVGQARLIVRITDGLHWNKPENEQDNYQQFWRKAGTAPVTLTGTYASIVHVADPGQKTEKLIHEEAKYLEIPELQRHYHFWEGLTGKEQEDRFRFLASKGIDVVHVSQGWGFWQKLDSGGKISPFGAELVARYYRLADQFNISVVQALSHYQYYHKMNKEGWGTPPNEAYFEAGFQDSEWENVQDGPFQRLFAQYLKDYGLLFKDETAILMLSTSGEGDQKAYAARCTWVEQQMATNCPKIAFYSEPIHIFYKKPTEHLAGWPPKTIGSRTYTMGALIRSDFDLIFYFRLNRNDQRIIMAEGAFPAPGLYSKFHFKASDQRSESWIATDYYRLHVRDNLYQGLVMGMPILLTWEEQFTEDERVCLKQCLKELGEPFVPQKPSVELLFDEKWYKERAKYYQPILDQYASGALSDFAIVEKFSDDNSLKIDPSIGLTSSQLVEWKAMSPFVINGSYKAVWAKNVKGQQLIYLYNDGGQKNHEVLYAKFHRISKPMDFKLDFGKAYKYHVWDLNTRQHQVLNGKVFNRTKTDADYLILLEP